MHGMYQLKNQRVSADSAHLQVLLASIYNTEERPLCLCTAKGVPMYVAKYGEFVLKRMPDTGSNHHPACDSFAPEPGVSGRAEMGAAIDDKCSEAVEIKLGFALSRRAGRALPVVSDPADAPPSEVEVKAPRCSLRGLVHYLWDEAGLNRWYPRMNGKRGQWTLHKHLTLVAQRVRTKGVLLAERLYIPEVFKAEHKAELAERRRKHLSFLHSPDENVQFKMGVVIGEFNGVELGATGLKVFVKHAPDAPLHISAKNWQRVARSYADVLNANDADVAHKPHLVMGAVIYATQEHVYEIEAMYLMLVSEQWIPLEGVHEIPLVERLIECGRVFIKPLRYDAKSAAPFPNALLLDAGPEPIHMHVVGLMADDKLKAIKEKQVRQRGALAWEWITSNAMPELPIKAQVNPRWPLAEPAPAVGPATLAEVELRAQASLAGAALPTASRVRARQASNSGRMTRLHRSTVGGVL
jgi:Protein of unknown function (DUF1173)